MKRSAGRYSAAFSLVELLVAVAICAVLGATVFACLFGSFGLWERGMRNASAIGAADAFDMAFARDFASSVPARPFTGAKDKCEMLTLHAAPQGETELVRVRYSIMEEGISREVWRDAPAPGNPPPPDERDDYATANFRGFAYAGTNSAEAAWSDTWDDATPKFVSLECAITDPPVRRVYVRRAEERQAR